MDGEIGASFKGLTFTGEYETTGAQLDGDAGICAARRGRDRLGGHFGIRRLLLEGGGHINGGFFQAGLLDELSLMLAPGIVPVKCSGGVAARNPA